MKSVGVGITIARDPLHGSGRAAVVIENSVGPENAEVAIVRAMMVATMMSSLFTALFAFVASSFLTRGALQAEILALRNQPAVLQNNAPRRLRFNRTDRNCGGLCYRDSGRVGATACRSFSPTRSSVGTGELLPGIGQGNRGVTREDPRSLPKFVT
jgi:hypothetical protein